MGTIIQLILSLFGGGMKGQVMDIITNVLLKGQGQGGAAGSPAAGQGGSGAGNPLEDLMSRFKEKGLGDVFGSWVSNGKNQAISPDQVRDAVGDEQMQEMAKKSGMNVDDLSSYLSKYLPKVVDNLTPNGRMPGQ
jgi:uncharacterized protein YidB (DUF937 family)